MAEAHNQATTRGAFIVWKLTPYDPEGEWVQCNAFSNKTVMIEGGSATLYGAMSKGGASMELLDSLGNPIKSPSIFTLSMNPMLIQPRLISGAAVTVSIVGTGV